MSVTKESAVGVFVVIGLICVAYLTIKLGKKELIGDAGYTLNAEFTSVSGLRNGAAIEIAGVRVGRVTSISLDKDHPVAHVAMRINHDVSVYDDAIASIKTSGLIGDKYIALSPGGGGDKLENNGSIYDTQPDIDLITLISKYVFGGV